MTIFKGYTFTSYSVCKCGAITVFTDDRKSFSSKDKTLLPDLSDLKELQSAYCCDHCVNHYGLDLCGCGSGEKFGECENGYKECLFPMQSIEQGRECLIGEGAWI